MAEQFQVTLPAPARFIPGRQNGSQVLVDPEGFMMRYKWEQGSNKFYMCSKKKSLNCEVKLTLNTKDNMVVSIRGKHSHDNNLVKDEVTKKVKNQLRDITNQPYTAPRSVIQSLATKVLEDPKTKTGLGYLPKPNTISKGLSRKRKAELDCPQLPSSFSDFSVPESMKLTADNQEFLILETQLEGKDDKVVGFSSPTLLQVLRESMEWYIDGTWDIVRETFFTQAWVVVARLNTGISLPCAFFCLPNKQPICYKLALEAIKNKGVDAPSTVHLDFEQAEIKAVKEVYPESHIVTCH